MASSSTTTNAIPNGVTGDKRKRDDSDDSAAPPPPPPPPPSHGLDSAVYSSTGTRATQEDRHIIIEDGWSGVDGASSSWPTCRFFGIFDGHSGDAAAELAATALWPALQSKLAELLKSQAPPLAPAAIESAMRDAFASTDERVVSEAGSSGSTATVALVLGAALCVANLGDSRTVLCRSERKYWETSDHKPDEPRERQRIEAAGGHVSTPRAEGQINVPRLNGVLSVSRGLGDAMFKQPAEAANGNGGGGDGNGGGGDGTPLLSAEPEITHRTISRFDEFLLLASDGLFDVMSSSYAVEIARNVVIKKERGAGAVQKTLKEKCQGACDMLVRSVVHSGHCSDNVTVVLALLNEPD